MKVIIIQDREVYTSNNRFYRSGLTEFIKYSDLFTKFSYLAPFNNISIESSERMHLIGDNVKFVELSITSKLDLIWLKKKNIQLIDQLLADYDLFIIKMPSLALGEYVIKEAKRLNKKVVVEVVGCAWDSYYYYGFIGKIIAPLNYFKNKYYISKADYAIYVTESFLQNRYPITGESIACSNVYLQEFKDKSIDYSAKDLKSEGFNIITISPVDIKFRGHNVVFKALKLLQKKNVPFKYYLVGSGNPSILQRKAKSLGIADSVVFLGKKAHTEISEILDTCNLYVHPSKAEGLPRSLIEAMSRALPCIASKTAGNPELLDEKYIYSKNSHVELFNILQSLSEAELTKMSKKNLDRSKDYCYNTLTIRRKEFFDKITKCLR